MTGSPALKESLPKAQRKPKSLSRESLQAGLVISVRELENSYSSFYMVWNECAVAWRRNQESEFTCQVSTDEQLPLKHTRTAKSVNYTKAKEKALRALRLSAGE